MDPSYAARYRDLAVRHWWWRARNDCVRRVVTRLLDGRREATMLDIGCGDGVLFPFLSQFGRIEGIEPDPTVVSPDSAWRSHIQIRPFDASFAPGRRYDLVLMLDVLEHLADPSRAIRHIADLLGDDGRLLVTVPAFRMLWTEHDNLNHHIQRFTKGTLKALTGEEGFDTEESWYLFQWLFFAKLAARAREAIAGRSGPEEVPADRLNDALYRFCAIEQRLMPHFVPFGSSVIAVLRKRREVEK